MKYFAKYLPVEGRIYQMDKYLDEEGNVVTRNLPQCDDAAYEGLQKVKLFLCSRDIQVGDKVKWIDIHGTVVEGIAEQGLVDKESISSFGYFKDIGEISKEATWVKEGDEFEEDEVSENWERAHGNMLFPIGHVKERFDKRKLPYILFKCKCCGTFK